MFALYISSFFLSQLGFLLGKSTLAEHKEIKKYTLFTSECFKLLFYASLVYLFYDSYLIILFLILFAFHIISKRYNNSDLLNFHNILLLSLSLLLIYKSYLFLVLILIFSIIIENSFREFRLKEELYSLIFYVIIYLLFGIIV
jgi:hypothetical protein